MNNPEHLFVLDSLMFTHNFLRRLIESLWSVERCLVSAYEETLGRHHGLVVRSVFSVAIKRSPNRCIPHTWTRSI